MNLTPETVENIVSKRKSFDFLPLPDRVHVNHKEFIVTSTPGDWGNKRLFDGNLHHYYNTKHGNTGFHTRPAGSGEVVTLIVDTLKERYLRYMYRVDGVDVAQETERN